MVVGVLRFGVARGCWGWDVVCRFVAGGEFMELAADGVGGGRESRLESETHGVGVDVVDMGRENQPMGAGAGMVGVASGADSVGGGACGGVDGKSGRAASDEGCLLALWVQLGGIGGGGGVSGVWEEVS